MVHKFCLLIQIAQQDVKCQTYIKFVVSDQFHNMTGCKFISVESEMSHFQV